MVKRVDLDNGSWEDMHKDYVHIHNDEKLVLSLYRSMKYYKWYLLCYGLGFLSCAFIIRFII